ncbi:hypothetical protein KY284_014966 [Solanum tuberosum]|nr:hypothetical protein KY284_014966 [Solanum tuberosum]
MEDNLGFTVVNFSCLDDSGDRDRHEPFIFAEQAQQVIFVKDPQDHEWFVPRLIRPTMFLIWERKIVCNSSHQCKVILLTWPLMDEHNFDQAQPYIEQLINSENHNQTQDHDDQSNELTNSAGGTDESGILEARKLRGPTLLNDIWKLPPGKTIDVAFNSGTQAIGKEGQKFSSFLGIIARTPVLTPLHIGDWRNFDNEEKKKLLNFVRRRTQANRNNRTKRKMPHTGGSKSIVTLMDDQTANGREPTRAEIFLLPHKLLVDGGPLDDDSAKEIKRRNSEGSTDQLPHRVAWKGDVYSQFPGADSGHGQITQTTGIPSVAENTPTSHGITHLCPLVLLFELPQSHLHCC